MSLPWDQETANALRAAQAVLAPADLAWFEAAQAAAFLDPAAAMERIFGELLGSDAGPAADAELEPQAIGPMHRRESHDAARAPMEPAARPALASASARRIARDPHARSLSIRPHRPPARDDASDPVGARDPAAPARAGAIAARPSMPGTPADAPLEPAARVDAASPQQRAASRDVSAVEDHPGSNGIRRALVAPAPPASRSTARADRHPEPGARVAAPELPSPRETAAPGTRLVTGLSALNSLFRSAIERQSDDRLEPQPAHSSDRLVPQPARSREQLEAQAARPFAPDEFGDAADPHELTRPDAAARWSVPYDAIRPDAFRDAADLHDVIRPDASARRSEPPAGHAREAALHAPFAPERQLALRADAPRAAGHAALETPLASFAGTVSPLPDAAREDVLLDRLIDRFEERLREQAIRHLGFTGGLT